MLERAKGRWTEELLSVLCTYQTTLRRSTSETPYSLTYGAELVILVEISLSSTRISDFSLVINDELMTKQLDLLEEHQEMATIRLANYQQKMAQRYDKGVGSRRCLGHQFRKACLELGGAVGHCHCWGWGILPRGYGGETTSPTMECSKLKKILPLNM